jgi:hypothetical protein
MLRETLDTKRRVLGSEHKQTIGSMIRLGATLLNEGRPDSFHFFGKRRIVACIGPLRNSVSSTAPPSATAFAPPPAIPIP